MLVGRDDEVRQVDTLLRRAREGSSGVLVVRGEPGIGKTALLDEARRRADGMAVVSARGVESESELAFSGLAELLRPLLALLDAVPPAQAEALRGVFALGPPAEPDPFAAYAGTLSLLAAAAEERPLLALLDDAHWLDAASGAALVFAARRLGAEGIALLAAARDGEPSPLDGSGLPELVLRGLDEAAARELVARASGGIPSPAEVERLVAGTGGNPLALVEAARHGAAADPPAVGAALEQAFLRRVADLPEATRTALLVAAAAGAEPLDVVAEAARRLGAGESALERAEAAGLVAVADRLEFVHPLVRSAVYHGAGPAERREAHRVLAELDGLVSADRRAWHLAHAAVGYDDAAAAALERAAASAHARGSAAAAAAALDRAAALTAEPAARGERLAAAAHAYALAGRPERAQALLDEALPLVDSPAARADVQLQRARLMIWREPREAHALLAEESDRIARSDRLRAASMLVEASMLKLMAGDTPAALETSERATRAARGAGGPVEAAAMIVQGQALLLRGELERGTALVERCASELLDPESPLRRHHFMPVLAFTLAWLERFDEASGVLRDVVRWMREASAPAGLPLPLACLSDVEFRTGRWASAYANAAEAVRLAEETGQPTELGHALVTLARVEAARGLEADCRLHVSRALDLVALLGTDALIAFAGAALGLLELGRGRAEEAAAQLARVDETLAAHGVVEPNVAQSDADLVEALVRAGRRDDAEQALARFEARAGAGERSTALAAAARCRGLLAAESDFETHFEEALALYRRVPIPFERARTELVYGERLRRQRRRGEARALLHAALAEFEALGAAPWVERARLELDRAGAGVRRTPGPALDSLTPQELQVALVVADGATNKEAAAALFLSPKTIDFHLRNIYEKLGIRSRTELAGLVLAERPTAAAAAPAG